MDDDDFAVSQTYVTRRRSEIEARIRSTIDEVQNSRKYSEGTLTFSKMPWDFVFPNDERHLVYDSNDPQRCHTMGREEKKKIADYSPLTNRRNEHGINGQFLNELNSLLTKKLDDVA